MQVNEFRFLGRLSLSIILTVGLIVTSCGPKTENKSLSVSNALQLCQSESSPIFESLDQLFLEHQQGLNWLSRLTFETPKRQYQVRYLSRAQLETQASLLLRGELASQSTAQIDQAFKYKEELRKLAKLKEQAERLEFLECHMGNYYRLGKIPFKSYVDLKNGNTHLEHVVELCSVLRNKPSCLTESRLIRGDDFSAMMNKYLKKFEDKFLNPRFKLTTKLEGLECKKTSAGNQLIFPVNGSEQDIIAASAAAQWWSSQQAKFQLSVVASDSSSAIKIQHINAGPSHVNMHDRNEINLGPGLASPLIIAHEMGHILGFPDCYFEAWDKDSESFIYIELDPTGSNLMCNINGAAKVPSDYFKQLEASYCD
tara:strand:+ start:419 stop:1525 length:1107 start_codon:yes stop_codon:yes gene_type:complete